MKLFVTASVVLASVLAFGCSSSSSGSGNVGSASSALATFKKPTGSFNANNSKQAIAGLWSQQEQGGKLQGQSSGGGGVATRTIKPLADSLSNGDSATGGSTQCAEGQKCQCESGGSFSYKQEPVDEGKGLRIAFDACMSADGSGFDGEALIVVSQKPLLTDEKLPAATAGQSVLLVAEGKVLEGKQSEKVSLAVLVQPNIVLVAAEVDDGKVVVGATSDGTVIVRAKDQAWTCKASKTDYICKEDSSGEAITVADSTKGASGKSPAPAPSTSGSNKNPPTPPKG